MKWMCTVAMVLAVRAILSSGGKHDLNSIDSNIRTEQMLNEPENLRQIQYEIQKHWMNDQPSHLTPIRVQGGVGP